MQKTNESNGFDSLAIKKNRITHVNLTQFFFSLTQLVGQCIIIIRRGRGSNAGHPTYLSYKVNSSH